MEKIKITQVVNAGILIEALNKKILIDGIHNTKIADWSTIDNELMNHMIYGTGKYNNINYLLFSHQHSDHFSKEKTYEYIYNNTVEKLIITDFIDKALERKNLLVELKTNYFEVGTIELCNINIKYFRTRHLEEKKYGISHYSFIISIGNINILYIGDADFSKDELIEPLKNYKINTIIAPFLIINSTPGRVFVKKVDPDLLILNHLPNKDDDKYNFRSFVEKDIKKYISEMPKTVIFQNLNDNLIIHELIVP